jgi:hypothetical protein
MPTIFDTLSASERKRIANQILDMNYEQQREFVEQLSSIVELNAKAESGLERKKVALERINAAKADGYGDAAAIRLLNGTLRRGGLPQVEELVEKSPDEIMKLFAASSMASMDKMASKSTLSKLKIIP